MGAMTRDEAVTRLAPALEGRGLRLAVLFGSGARDALREDSDLDVAILPSDPGASLAGELALEASLVRLTGRSVDLVRLDKAGVPLRWRVAREGVVLLAEPRTEWTRFQARAAIEHAEMEPMLAAGMERYRRRLAAGQGDR